jgi:4-amino-4-deoxy-L-arabinose transferase-like glycosyltransferase
LQVRRPASVKPRYVALALLLAGAAALRLDGHRYGLPFPLLNADERSIVPRAWMIGPGEGFDPHWYDYPSLVFYLLAPFQWSDEAPSYGAARLVVIVLGVAAVAAAWWLGRSAYGPAGGWVGAGLTAVATTHVAYSRMAVTDMPLALGTTVALGLALAGRIELAGLAAGLATSAKYPGVLLVAPLLVAGWGRWRRLAVAAGLGALAFAVTSPFVLLHPGRALDDVTRVQRRAREGWLGFEDDPATPLAFLELVWEAAGPVAVLAALGLAVALWQRRRADLVLVTWVAVYFASLLPIEAHFDRYVLPLVAPLGVLAARVRPLAPAALLLLAIPLAWTLADSAELRDRDTRELAQPRVLRLVPPDQTIAVDSSAPPLDGRPLVGLPLPHPEDGPELTPSHLDELEAQGVRWVLVTGGIADRVFAARAHYPDEAAFYDELRRRGRRVLYVDERSAPDLSGPWIALYRL